MNAIPLVRARYASAFITALRQYGVSPAPHLRAAKLPEALLDHDDRLIPALGLWRFAGTTARDTGIAALGLDAGMVPVADHGEFGTRVIYAPNLYQAVQTFCREARAEYSRADFYLERDGETAWFCRGPIDGAAHERQQVELYVLMLMIQTVRMALGSGWRPATLHLQSTDERGLADVELLRRANTRFGAQRTAMAVPVSALDAGIARRVASGASRGRAGASDSGELPTDLVGSLRHLLKDAIRNRPPSVEFAAEMAGASVRTLQRQLKLEGLTYSQLLEQVRLQSAVPMLQDGRLKITDIAYELGYLQPAHFTRAFQRWLGISPREYRTRRRDQ